MKRIAILGFILILLALGSQGFSQHNNSPETKNYIKRFKGVIRSFSKDELLVSVINENPEDAPLPEYIKHYAEFLIIVPDHYKASQVLDSVTADMYLNDRKSDTTIPDSQNPPFPEWVAYKDIGIFRSHRLAQLKVMVAKPLSTKNKSSLRLNRIDFRVKFSKSGATENPEPFPPDPMATGLLQSLVLNPECESLYRLTRAPDLNEFEPYTTFVDRVNDALSSGPVVKMIIYRGGLYGVSGNDLDHADILIGP